MINRYLQKPRGYMTSFWGNEVDAALRGMHTSNINIYMQYNYFVLDNVNALIPSDIGISGGSNNSVILCL